MSHKQQQVFCASVRAMFQKHFVDANVLDVGSMDVNGSTRSLFQGGSYLGIDIHAGKGVDRVCRAWEVDGEFDVVISTECLEHDETWPATIRAMELKTKSGGLMVMTCAGPGRGEHGTRRCPIKGMVCETDYYMNLSPLEFLCRLDLSLWRRYAVSYSDDNCDTYFWGIKR